MKTIHTDGISYIEPVPGGTSGWYFGVSLEHGDLYEAEEICSDGFPVEGNSLVLILYPDGAVFRPLPKQAGTYSDTPVFLDGSIFCLNVDFLRQLIRIVRFDCKSGEVRTEAELPLGAVKNCYNLKLHTSPLCLTRQGDDDVFEIVWPEKARFPLGLHESFFLRDGKKLFFSRWHEEGEGRDYRYWEETVVRDLNGNLTEVLPGDIRRMPDGDLWHLV